MDTRFSGFGKQTYVRLALVFLAWTAYGLFFASQSIIRQGLSRGLSRHLVPWLLCAYCWAILTPLVIRIASRFPFAKGKFARAFIAHIPAAVGFSLLQLGLYSVVASFISGFGMSRAFALYKELVVEEVHQSVLVYALIVAIYSARHFFFKPDRVEIQEPPVAVINEPLTTTPADYLTRVSVKVNGRIVVLNIEDVEWIASEGNYVSLHSKAKTYLLRETMDRIEKNLDPDAFVRLRRSTIVRIDQIQELHPASKGEFEVLLKDGTRLSSTRRYRKNLHAALKV